MTPEQRVIFQAQGYLRNIARSDGDISMVYPDGIYAEETVKAVSDFQRKQGIAQTGEIDFQTWERLVAENERVVFEASLPVQIARISNEDLPLIMGRKSELVYTLKLMLGFVASRYSGFESADLNDVFDAATQRNVKLWQRIISAEETGEVDKLTWNSLSSFYLLAEE